MMGKNFDVGQEIFFCCIFFEDDCEIVFGKSQEMNACGTVFNDSVFFLWGVGWLRC
jgi:hypothetical protein